MKRLHRVLLIGLHDALASTFIDGYYADKVLEKTFKANKKWGSKDRNFVASSFYEIVRYKRKYAYIIDSPIQENSIYSLITAYLLEQGYEIPTFDEFSDIPIKKIKKRLSEDIPSLAIELSYPDWIFEKLKAAYPNDYQAILTALNEPAKVYLRVNTLKTQLSKTIQELLKQQILSQSVEDTPNAIVLNERKNIFSTPIFKDGWIEVQDISSQKVALALNPKPGMRVIDACAGAGGKTLHLASLMENKGQIIALDIHEWKLKELKRRARRAGAHNIETRAIENSKTIKRLKDGADALLIDAPCTGLGVLKRNPDAKWKINEDFLHRVVKEQADILDRYSQMLRKGGNMVYATCSILPEENEQQIEQFLSNHPDFELMNQEHLLPHQTGYDGFFIAHLTRKTN